MKKGERDGIGFKRVKKVEGFQWLENRSRSQ